MTAPEKNTLTNLREVILQLVGTVAWRSRVGSGTGSIFTLEFGPELPTDTTQGRWSLMVYCAWRIVTASRVLVSWHDEADTILALGLAALEGLVVSSVEISAWGDLAIRFSNGKELQLMNDLSESHDFDTSWFITFQGHSHFIVGPGNVVTSEPAN